MGNEQNKANFDMNVQLIGEGMIDFFNIIKSSSRYKTIKDYWTFDYEEKTFEITPVTGSQKISFVFLPGSNFDFKWFRFR